MNKIFKVKRNSLGQSVVCSEIATSRSKCRVIASALALTIASSAMAQGQVKSEFINTNDVRATFIGTEALTGEEMLSSYSDSDSDSDNVITPDTLLKTANYIGKTDQTLPQKALNDFHIENLQTDLDDANINLQNIFDWAHQAYETIEDHHAALDGVGDIVSALSATDDVLIDEIAENTNDIFKLAVISETTVDEVAKNRAALEAHTDSINELGVATNVLIDEIAENTNDIFKLAVISETTVDEVAKNRAALEAHTDSINELGVATNVLIDEIAENTNDIFKLAVISETTVDEVAKNRAALEAHTDSINELGVATNVLIDEIAKNQADIATLMSKSPAAVDLQPINDKIDALSSNVDGKINKLNEKLSAGVAGSVALAMMPAPAAGSQYITGGTGFYNGESAIALGFTGASETGKFTYKLGGSLTSSGSGTFGAGAGYRWR